MSDPLTLVLAWLAGSGLGGIFFGGLWWTVRRVVSAKRPALWIAGSFLLRTSAAVAGLYVVSGQRVDRLLFCLLGFVTVRFVVTRLTRSSVDTERPPRYGVTRAA